MKNGLPVLAFTMAVTLTSIQAHGDEPARAAGAASSGVRIDFTATVSSVNPLLPELAGLVGESGVGHIRYTLNPVAMDGFRECLIYYFDEADREFSFELPAADLALHAGAAQNQFNVEVCDGFRDFIDDGPLVLVDRIRFFGYGIGGQLGTYPLSNLVIRFADTTATAVSDMALSNILVPERYDVRNFWIMISLGGGTTTAGITLSIDSVMVERPSCTGDCDGNGQITIGELIRAVNISLGTIAAADCDAFDAETPTIAELVQAVRYALEGCP